MPYTFAFPVATLRVTNNMLTQIPLTAATTLVGSAVTAYAAIYLSLQIRDPRKSIQPPVRYMQKYFILWSIFFACMSVPYLWTDNAARFSLSAAWAYVVGHIFIYIGLMYISRTTFALVPRLSAYSKYLAPFWLTATVVVTAINAKTMIWGVQPTFNHKLHLTEFHTSPAVGIPLAVMAVLAFMPAVILFLLSAVRARGINRIKPALISLGFLFIIIGGPMHDNARTAQLYAVADFFTTLGMIVILFGVAFRVQTELTAAPSRRYNVHAPSNTV